MNESTAIVLYGLFCFAVGVIVSYVIFNILT